jgi:hypothetical protein
VVVSGNSGTGGPGSLTPEALAWAREIVGVGAQESVNVELDELKRLVERYPAETARFLAELGHRPGDPPVDHCSEPAWRR